MATDLLQCGTWIEKYYWDAETSAYVYGCADNPLWGWEDFTGGFTCRFVASPPEDIEIASFDIAIEAVSPYNSKFQLFDSEFTLLDEFYLVANSGTTTCTLTTPLRVSSIARMDFVDLDYAANTITTFSANAVSCEQWRNKVRTVETCAI